MPALLAPAHANAPGLPSLRALHGLDRSTSVAISVVALHVLMLWALQSGLLRRAVEVIVPVQMLGELVDPPAPKIVPLAPTKPAAPQIVKPKAIATPAVQQPQAPSISQPLAQPMAIADPTPAPNTLVGSLTPQPELAPATQPVSVMGIEPVAPPVPVRAAPSQLELPSSDADYLQNPPPVYPAMSKRLNEQGQVIHSVMIGVDGLPINARLVKSSGFDRLDQAAYKAVMGWRYTPGKRNGVVTAMAYNAPINWVLE